MKNLKYLCLFAIAIPLSAVHASTPDVDIQKCIAASSDVEEKIECLPNLRLVSKYRYYQWQTLDLRIKQPVDHENPKSEKFEQRIVLHHLDEESPLLLQTSGYNIFGIALSFISKGFLLNQIQVEHRYFANSRPKKLDWSKLTIKQSAADFHNITKTLKNIYPKPWINTGASKGGMTSIYHRYFYPDDIAGTIADVAPLSFAHNDQRYVEFLKTVGGDELALCRQELKRIQVEALESKEKHASLYKDEDYPTGALDAFESAVASLYFVFWQYEQVDKDYCKKLTKIDNFADIHLFVNQVSKPTTTRRFNTFLPYYYQAYVELGYPGSLDEHYKHLLSESLVEEEEDYFLETFGVKELPFSDSSMRAVEKWAREEADNIIYVYGEFDPWTAGEFPVSETGKRTVHLYSKADNHGAKFRNAGVSEKDFSIASGLIKEWLGEYKLKQGKTRINKAAGSISLEEIERQYRKEHGL